MNISSQFLFKLVFELSKKDVADFSVKLKYSGREDCLEIFEKIISSYDGDSNKNIPKFEKNLKQNLSADTKKYYRVKKSKLKKELLLFIKDKNIAKDLRYPIREKIDIGVALAEFNYANEGLLMITEAKEEAKKEEFFEEVLYALEKERSYDFKIRKNIQEALAHNNEMEHYLNLLQNANQYVALSLYLFSFQGDYGANKEVIAELKRSELLSDEKNALSLVAKKFFYLSWLDIYNVEQDYESMYQLVPKAVAFAAHAASINEIYSRTLLLMYGRLEFSADKLDKHDESLKLIELIENFDVPKIYENNSFFNRMMNISVKIRRINNYSKTGNPKLKAYCKEIETYLDQTKISDQDRSHILYNLIFNFTVKIQDHKHACVLGKKFVNHVIANFNQTNPYNNQTIQSFLCYFLSAYVCYTEDTFEYIFEYLFKKKNSKYFVPSDAPFHYVFKLYKIFLKAFNEPFYSEELLSEYFGLWEKFPEFLPKANNIPKLVLQEKYNKKLVEQVTAKYDKVKFEF